MRIEWAENPLASKVILTPEEAEKLSDLEELSDEDRDSCLKALQGLHNGDCVKYPSICLKCLVEQDIGVNTLEGLSGYTPYWIRTAFRSKPKITIDDAINYIETQCPAIGTWKQEILIAAAELKQYRDKYRSHQQGAT